MRFFTSPLAGEVGGIAAGWGSERLLHLGRCGFGGFCLRSRCRCFRRRGDLAISTDFDHGDLRPGLYRLAFLGQDLAQDARDGSRHLGVDLVRIHLEHRLELDDLVARLDEPARDGALVHGFAELGHDDPGGLAGHQNAARSFRTLVILSGVGMKYSSIGIAYGIDGTSSPPKRLTGSASQRHASSAIRAATSVPIETLALSSYRTSNFPGFPPVA